MKKRLPSTNPKLLPQSKTEDRDAVSDNGSSASLEATRRALSVFLLSYTVALLQVPAGCGAVPPGLCPQSRYRHGNERHVVG